MRIKLVDAVTRAIEVGRKGLQKELEDQGHRLAGGLIKNLETVVTEQGDTVTAKIVGPDFAVYIDAGVRPERVRYPVRIMIEYFQKRGLPLKEATRAGWATRAIHKREGIPTKASFRFSKNGRRTGFVKAGIEATILQMRTIFAETIESELVLEVTQIFYNNGERREYNIEF